MTWISTPRGLYGESGIRTHGTLTSTHAFQACTLGHSVISPCAKDGARSSRAWTHKRRPRPARAEARRRHGWQRRRASTTDEARADAHRALAERRTPKARACKGPGAPAFLKQASTQRLISIAERVGFEPTEPQAAQRFSRPPDSTALASLPAPRRSNTPNRNSRRERDGRVQERTDGRPTASRTTYSSNEHSRTAPGRRLRRVGKTQPQKQGHPSPWWGSDQALRAQEDSNLRPLDPQSNALSRLSYGHPTVSECPPFR